MKKNWFFDLPYELLIKIYEYNSVHREQMYWSLDHIKKLKFCDLCKKTIINKNYGWIWGYSNCLNNYCSEKCRHDDTNDLDVY